MQSLGSRVSEQTEVLEGGIFRDSKEAPCSPARIPCSTHLCCLAVPELCPL